MASKPKPARPSLSAHPRTAPMASLPPSALQALQALVAHDEAFHRAVDLDDVATSLAFAGEALAPERWLAARRMFEEAVSHAESLLHESAAADGDAAPSILWDEALARLAWLDRYGKQATSAAHHAWHALLARYAAAGHEPAAVARRLHASHERCQAPPSPDEAAWRPLCRFVARADVVATIRAVEQLALAAVEPPTLPGTPDEPQPSPAEALLDREGVADRLGVSVATVDRLIAAGMPHIRPGRGPTAAVRVRWDRALAWLEQRQRNRSQPSVRRPRRDAKR